MYTIAHLLQKTLMLFNRPYFPGACLFTEKDTLTTIGGFDTNVLLGEDVDYSLRASKLGSHGLINESIKVSSRRIIKYGYSWIFKEMSNVLGFIFTGRIRSPERMFYPFGEF